MCSIKVITVITNKDPNIIEKIKLKVRHRMFCHGLSLCGFELVHVCDFHLCWLLRLRVKSLCVWACLCVCVHMCVIEH